MARLDKIYQCNQFFFWQGFKIPCLCTGAQIFTPNSGWPMSWRLDENPQVHGAGILPECFTVYSDKDDLLCKLNNFKTNFNSKETPLKVFNEFINYYWPFYKGNNNELDKCLNYIKNKVI